MQKLHLPIHQGDPDADDTWLIGIGGAAYDYSVAVAAGLDIRVAIEAERITRVKYGVPRPFQDPLRACIDYCTAAAAVPKETTPRLVSSDLLPFRLVDRWSITTYPHHLCHAASVVMLLEPETRACVLVYDGTGSGEIQHDNASSPLGEMHAETISFFEFRDGRLTPLGATHGRRRLEWQWAFDGNTNSIGQLYDLATSLVGFDRKEAGKTMGLAGWGVPRFLDDFADYVRFGSTVADVFQFDPFNSELHETLAGRIADENNSFAVRADLAATVQELTTQCLIRCYQLVEARDFDVFCVAGGVGLNVVANGQLAKRLPAGRRLLVPPHSGDVGVGLGAMWLERRTSAGETPVFTVRGMPASTAIARPGRIYGDQELLAAARRDDDELAEDSAVDGPEALAALLASGAIIGVFDAGSEIGPRALGGRSILADPRNASTKERINREIKFREPFRPLAPVVRGEDFDDYFEPPAAASPYMLIAADTTPRCRRCAPATVHVDGTARVQAVSDASDPFLAALLSAFGELTGVPILLNTSFNRRGEPIVETPADAVNAFCAMGLDGLWLQGRYLFRPGRSRQKLS